jgi:lipopolysaccharide biosynthesis glycosyltransferase
MVVKSLTSTFKFCDQRILNYLLFGRVCEIPSRWNMKCGESKLRRYSKADTKRLFETAGILHYAGAVKPRSGDFKRICNTGSKTRILKEWKRHEGVVSSKIL